MLKCLFIIWLCLLFAGTGCQVSSVMFEPTPRERVIPAQFDLKQALQGDQTVLVAVDRSIASGGDSELVEGLSSGIGSYLSEKVKISEEKIHFLGKGSGFSTLESGFSRMSPYEVGERTGDSFVLFITILNYELYQAGHKDYYTGELAARAGLYDVSEGVQVWPRDRSGRTLRMRVELETNGRDQALGKLVSSMSHGITRYLYDCKRGNFRSSYEAVDYTREAFE